jgi:hypothetical protein
LDPHGPVSDQTLRHPKSKTIASAAATTATVQNTIIIRCFGSLNILISGGDSTDPAQAPVNPHHQSQSTNNCLAKCNKSCMGAKATNKQPAARRNSSGTAKLARPVAGSALAVVTALWRREAKRAER